MSEATPVTLADITSITMIHEDSGKWMLWVCFSGFRQGVERTGLLDPFECIEEVAKVLGIEAADITIPVSVAPGGPSETTTRTPQPASPKPKPQGQAAEPRKRARRKAAG